MLHMSIIGDGNTTLLKVTIYAYHVPVIVVCRDFIFYEKQLTLISVNTTARFDQDSKKGENLKKWKLNPKSVEHSAFGRMKEYIVITFWSCFLLVL